MIADAEPLNTDHILHELGSTNADRVRLAGVDIDGVLRGKYISMEKFESALKGGLGFCDVIFGWDSQDELYEGVDVKITGWHTGYPDLHATIDPSSYRRVPWDRGVPFFLLDFAAEDGSPYAASPRQLLKSVVQRAAQAGYTARFSAEYEFFLFREDERRTRFGAGCSATQGQTTCCPGEGLHSDDLEVAFELPVRHGFSVLKDLPASRRDEVIDEVVPEDLSGDARVRQPVGRLRERAG